MGPGGFSLRGVHHNPVHVTVEVVGEDTHEFDVTDERYVDLLNDLDLSPHAVAVFVDGRPVPEDRPVKAQTARVVRLVRGG